MIKFVNNYIKNTKISISMIWALLIIATVPNTVCAQLQSWSDIAAAPEVSLSIDGDIEISDDQDFLINVKVDIPDGYLLYSPIPRGQEVQPIALEVTVSGTGDLLKAGKPLYPAPVWHKVNLGGLTEDNLVYEHDFDIFVPLTLTNVGKKSADAQALREISIELLGQLCDENGCYRQNVSKSVIVTMLPGNAVGANSSKADGLFTAEQLDAKFPQIPAAENDPPAKAQQATATESNMTTIVALAVALAAGIALNVMPCVLPVIPLKILSIIQQAGDSNRRRVTLGMAYAVGILSFFLLVGIVSVAVRIAGDGVFNLNEPFKSPGFIIAMVLLLTAAAGWLFGAFTLFAGGISAGSGQNKGGIAGSVAMGFFTALLATPCSGPVLAAVFGWAQWHGPAATMAVFAALGIGMALPHAILASMPKLLDKLPKPGMWTERLRQFMGFILLIVAAWLLSVLGEAAWIFRVAALAVILSACLWTGWTVVGFNNSRTTRRAVRLLVIVIFAAATYLLAPQPAKQSINWKDFDQDSIAAQIENGDTVLVKYTAKWCTLCKLVDIKIFSDENTAQMLKYRDVKTFKADVTWDGSEAETFLTENLSEPGPPLTVIYGPAIDSPIKLRGVYTAEELTDALDDAQKGMQK